MLTRSAAILGEKCCAFPVPVCTYRLHGAEESITHRLFRAVHNDKNQFTPRGTSAAIH
jgi:hypothetical protein